jgi:predicted lipoprotein with Yx(FWY)xxD motif
MRLSIIGSMVVAAALLIAACGGGSGSSSTPAATSPSGTALVNSASTDSLGSIVVGPSGRTLYVFKKDTGPSSTCSGACAAEWPPLTTTAAKVTSSGEVSATALKAVRRSDGKMQVTFDGHPLYYFAGDGAAGDAKGQGLDTYGAKWYVVAPSGKEITSGPQQPSGGY